MPSGAAVCAASGSAAQTQTISVKTIRFIQTAR
jgi:hypothetical protein